MAERFRFRQRWGLIPADDLSLGEGQPTGRRMRQLTTVGDGSSPVSTDPNTTGQLYEEENDATRLSRLPVNSGGSEAT